VSFERPEVLAWLAAPVALLLFALFAVPRAARRRQRFFGGQAERLAPGFSPARRRLRDALAAGALLLCVAGLARPVWGEWLREVSQRGVDVMVVLDTSRSMLSDDLQPSRLERARREVRALADRMRGDRIGLVTFAGDARLICPLTSDPDSFERFLDEVDTWTNALGGTAVGEGLQRALESLEDAGEGGARAIVLLTDGEDHASDPPPTEIAYKARAMSVPIHVIVFGTPEGGTLRAPDLQGRVDYVRDEQGQPVLSRPDEELAQRIASIAGGAFLSAARAPFPMDEIWEKRLAAMEGVTRASSLRREPIDRYQWALCGALGLLLLRAIVRDGSLP